MRVLFTTQPGDGHLNPLIPLAKALVATGYEVAFACSSSFCSTVEARGFRAFPVGIDWLVNDMAAHWPVHQMTLAQIWGVIFAGDSAERALPDLLAVAEAWSPDVIVRDASEFGGWLAAEVLGLPHISVEVSLMAHMMGGAAPITASLTRLRRLVGLSPTDIMARLFAPLHLSFVPPSLEDPAAPLPPTAQSLRPDVLDPFPGEQPPAWLATLSGRPLVYATFGTLRRPNDTADLAAIIAGIRDLDIDLIVTVGPLLDPAGFGPQPRNVHLANYVSQAYLLPRCAAMVNHGGFSTVIGALSYGIPQVILPTIADNPVNARRAVALGTTIVLGVDERTPETICAAVQSVLADPAYRQRAQQVQAEIRALPGPERGVELLTQLVAAQRLVHRT